MKITASDGTGADFFGYTRHLDDDAIADFNTFEFAREQVRRLIDNAFAAPDACAAAATAATRSRSGYGGGRHPATRAEIQPTSTPRGSSIVDPGRSCGA